MGLTIESKILAARAIWGLIIGATLALTGEPANIILLPIPRWGINLLFIVLMYFPSIIVVKSFGITDIKTLIGKGFIVYISVAILSWIALY